MTQNIFNIIKSREKLKSKLQQKSNKSILLIKLDELSEEDKLKLNGLTKELLSKIQQFKEKYKINIVWKGICYEWVIFYKFSLLIMRIGSMEKVNCKEIYLI